LPKVAHNGDVVTMDIGTLATIVSMLSGFAALATFVRHDSKQLQREMRDAIRDARLEAREDAQALRDELKVELRHLDDRVYALAAGLNPLDHPGTGQPTR